MTPFLPYSSVRQVCKAKRECQGRRQTIQGIGLSVSLGAKNVGVIGIYSDGLYRLLYLPMVYG